MAVVTLGRYRSALQDSVKALEQAARTTEEQAQSVRREIANLQAVMAQMDELSERVADVWGLGDASDKGETPNGSV